MRWTLATAALLGLLLAIFAHSPGVLGFGVMVGLICGVAAAFAFIDAQIQARSRSEYMTPGELEALKATLRRPQDQSGAGGNLPPPTPQ